jgi:acyl-coenzyme A thioesterase PaaI-like protein
VTAAGDTPHDALVAATRRLADEVRVSAAPPEVMAKAAALVARAADLLEPHGVRGVLAQSGLDVTRPPDLTGRPEEIFPYSPAIGPLNPFAPPARFEVVGEAPDATVEGTVTFPAVLVGAPGLAHGGAVALLLDELLGIANVVNGSGAMTGTLTVRFVAPTPAGQPLTLHAERTGTERRKVFTRGEVRHGERVTAVAEGVFVQPPPGILPGVP